MNYRSNDKAEQPDLVLRLLPLSGKDRYARTPQARARSVPGLHDRRHGAAAALDRHGAHPVDRSAAAGRAWIRNTFRTKPTRSFSSTACGSRAKIAQLPALKPLVVRETRPGPDAQDDAALLDYMRETMQTSWHMVGTCRMGVDANGGRRSAAARARASTNLRVVDSSICPTIPSSNTNIASIAIGEKGAELMLAAARA